MIEFLLVAQTIVLVVFGILLLLVIRQVGVLSLRIGPSGSRTTGNGPAIGTNYTDDSFVERLIDEGWKNDSLNILVAFISPYCAGCRILLPVLNTVAREEKNHLKVIAVARDLDGKVIPEIKKEIGSRVWLIEDEELFERWNVSGTPYCVLLDMNNVVASKGISNSSEHIESLLTALEIKSATLEDFVDREFVDSAAQISIAQDPDLKDRVQA